MQNDQGGKNCEIQDGSQKMVVMADQCQKINADNSGEFGANS